MKYKVGDMILIKKPKSITGPSGYDNGLFWNEDMNKYDGVVATIYKIMGDEITTVECVRKEDNYRWMFRKEWITKVEYNDDDIELPDISMLL